MRRIFIVVVIVVVVVVVPVLALIALRARVAFFYREPTLAPPAAGVVCGVDGTTRSSEADAAAAGVAVLHAAACGACSNAADVEVMRRTPATLTLDSRACGMRYLLIGRDAAGRCLGEIGFTPACVDCWLDDMACAITHCMGICLKSRLMGEPNNVGGKLNDCLQCDETHCGPEFMRCAGANRRRLGIVSDIERPTEQIWHGGS